MFFKPQVLLKSLRGFDPTSRLPTQNLEPFVQIPVRVSLNPGRGGGLAIINQMMKSAFG